MAISRAQLAKELEPGLNSLFGMSYDSYDSEFADIFPMEDSQRAFEEEVLITGFGAAPTKAESAGVSFDNANESFSARYTHSTVALAFALTEEAVEDNLYDSLGKRYVKALARSMAHTKEVTAADVLNNAFSSSFTGDISTFTDDRGLTISVQATKLVVPPQLTFIADRILNSPGRSGTADNDINAIRNTGVLPGGYTVNHYLNDPDAFFLLTTVTEAGEGLKGFQRTAMETSMEPDFTTGNIRYKARERYSFGFSDWRGAYGSQGA